MNDLAVRLLPLEGGCNFRDMGGYATADGRRIRRNKLYRSGVMSYFSPADHERLTALGVRAICDLRRDNERTSEPTRWPVSVNIVSWNEDEAFESRGELSWRDRRDAEGAREAMLNLYRTMPSWLETRLRGIFDLLANGEVPLVFHCAAGKDRTGFSAALILHTLGVPRETIFHDYELTNHAVDLAEFMLRHRASRMGVSDREHPLTQMDPAMRDAVLSADSTYLAAAFQQIEQDHGNLDNYLQEALGINAAAREAIRRHLLED